MKSKSVTQIKRCHSNKRAVVTQIKALDEYFLKAVFTLLLNNVHVSANFIFNLQRQRNMPVKELK